MGILSAMMGQKNNTNKNVLIPAPLEHHQIKEICAKEAATAGFKAAVIAAAVSSVVVISSCRYNLWAKANLNYSAQALLISAATVSSYFITADKTIIDCAARHVKYDPSHDE